MEVLSEKCQSCIFRPGNKMNLNAGRVAGMVQECRETQSFIPCHETMEYEDEDADEPTAIGPMCRGFYEAHGQVSQLLRISERLGVVTFRDPPALSPYA